MIKYSNGKTYIPGVRLGKTHKHIYSAANRGMKFEEAINLSNEFYKVNKIALITKRPTPINVVQVDYHKKCRIVDAYFEKQSTTDYNGVYQGKYIDFEAKSTLIKTSFPLNNISKHQIDHLQYVIYHKGIAFFLIEFASLNEVYFLNANYVINFYNLKERKSIPIDEIRKNGILLKEGYSPRYNYLEALKNIV